MTGLEVVGLHCMHKKNWKLRVRDFNSQVENSQDMHKSDHARPKPMHK